MSRTTFAAVVMAVLLAAPVAGACTAPYEPMPFPVWTYGKHPRLLLREGQCVIDPGFWMYSPPPAPPPRPLLGRIALL